MSDFTRTVGDDCGPSVSVLMQAAVSAMLLCLAEVAIAGAATTQT